MNNSTYFNNNLFNRLIVLLFFILGYSKTYTQELDIGDIMPEVELQATFQPGQPPIKLSDYKGKLVILDFWTTGCGSCLSAFGKMDSLQKDLEGKVQVIFITPEGVDTVNRYFNRFNKVKRPTIPMITGDTVLINMFPHKSVPHHVWISPEGKVIAITSSVNTTKRNIEKFFNDGSIVLRKKIDLEDFDYSKPLAIEGNGRWWNRMITYSYLMHHPPFIQTTVLRTHNRMVYSSFSVVQLYIEAFEEIDKYSFDINRNVFLKFDNAYYYLPPQKSDQYEDWAEKYLYSYEIKKAEWDTTNIFSLMRKELHHNFGLKAHIRKAPVKAIVLVKDKEVLKTKRSKTGTNLYTAEKNKYLYNLPFKILSNYLNIWFSDEFKDRIYIDKTGISHNIDIEFYVDQFDGNLVLINKFLKKYGLRIELMEVLSESLFLED